jgi:hypothetical protein
MVAFDSPGPLAGAFRPQEGHRCRILNAAVRTINAYHEANPIDFVLLGGDNIDNAQSTQLPRAALLGEVAGALDGHGIGPSVQQYGKAFYWFDIEGTPLRVVVLDTAAETGSATGVLRTSDVDGFIRPALDAAKRDGKWVVLASHHASGRLGDGSLSAAGIEPQPDVISASAWTSLVGSYDDVLLHLAGHSHILRAAKVEPASGHAYWEQLTSALADYPSPPRRPRRWGPRAWRAPGRPPR